MLLNFPLHEEHVGRKSDEWLVTQALETAGASSAEMSKKTFFKIKINEENKCKSSV